MSASAHIADPLMPSDRAVHHWTTHNLGEAAPGVLTPLCLALWGETAERATRIAIHRIGVLRDDELEPPSDPADWILRTFYGRLAMQLEFFALIGDRTPGISGVEAIRGMFGEAPPGMTFKPTRQRYSTIAWKFPSTFVTFPRDLRRIAADQDRWWRESVVAAPSWDLAAARAAFVGAMQRFSASSSIQLVGTVVSVQPLYDATQALIATAGTGDISVLSGSGGAELAVVSDIWRASRGEIELAEIQRNHGFHGPGEGEVSNTVWREDETLLRKIVEQYANRPDADSPLTAEADKRRDMAQMQRAVVAALPAYKRPAARLVLRLAAERIPLRGVAKRAFLQAIDVARMSARRAGELLVAEHRIGDRDDVFFLTATELADLPADLRPIVAERRGQRELHQGVRFANADWLGLPELIGVADGPKPGDVSRIEGLGVSAGVVEGTVRVVTDLSFDDVEPDEVLVAPTTDPSWSSIMFISSALVVDIGGVLSHAAVVARELGIPCVVATVDGTRVLRTGDTVRVDGTAGTVEILRRAP